MILVSEDARPRVPDACSSNPFLLSCKVVCHEFLKISNLISDDVKFILVDRLAFSRTQLNGGIVNLTIGSLNSLSPVFKLIEDLFRSGLFGMEDKVFQLSFVDLEPILELFEQLFG